MWQVVHTIPTTTNQPTNHLSVFTTNWCEGSENYTKTQHIWARWEQVFNGLKAVLFIYFFIFFIIFLFFFFFYNICFCFYCEIFVQSLWEKFLKSHKTHWKILKKGNKHRMKPRKTTRIKKTHTTATTIITTKTI